MACTRNASKLLAKKSSLISSKMSLPPTKAMTSSQKASPTTIVRPCEQPIEIPKFYRTEPPPHHPVGNRKAFRSPWESAMKGKTGSLFDFLLMRIFDWQQDPATPAMDIPQPRSSTWTPNSNDHFGNDKILCTWVGHAGCHFQIPLPDSEEKVTVLTDPVFSKRCSPLQFLGPARLQPPPTSVEEMAQSDHPHAWPDILVLSHNHYDHLDYNTIESIVSRPNGKPIPHIFCPLGLKTFFLNLGIPESQVTELDWWHQRQVELQGKIDESVKRMLRLTCVPAQHFSGRGVFDHFQTLWAGWVMESMDAATLQTGKKVYFAGDTAYRHVDRSMVNAGKDHDMTVGLPPCPAFKEIGRIFGNLDLSMIPIGAYKPRPFMSFVHADPEEAVMIHKDVNSKRSIAIHWGTFSLAADGVNDPKKLLQAAVRNAGLTSSDFDTMNIGETRAF